jgi:hypothetical protein
VPGVALFAADCAAASVVGEAARDAMEPQLLNEGAAAERERALGAEDD